jgi:hypothetical protein
MERADLQQQGQVAPAQTLDHDGSAVAAGAPAPAGGSSGPGSARRLRVGPLTHRPVIIHLAVLIGFIAAGVAVTWPRASYLAGRLPATRDAGSYVWGFWWVARQVEHLSNPWFTRYIAAPTGTQLGLHALMPLPSVLMIPVTVIFGPSASYNLLSILMPGLLCYAAYRVARLWLMSQVGAIASGAFFGLSTMLTWRAWYHLNLAAGVLFFPLALEAAIRLRRRPGWRQALVLGLVVGGAILTDQEMAVLVLIMTAVALLPWLLRRPTVARLWPAVLAAVIAGLVASPQIIAVMQQTKSGGASSPLRALATSYVVAGVNLADMFSVSPRVRGLGLSGGIVYHGPTADGIPTFGLVLSVLALLGLILAWRRSGAWLLALLWLGCGLLALGSVLKIGTHVYIPAAKELNGQRVSMVMPYTWFVKLPVLSGFREASRIMMLGILPAALLAGAAVDWLRYHAAKALVVVAVLGLLEAGWSGNSWIGSMPTSLPAVDRPIAADHSHSIVVDIPYGIRGGTNFSGKGFDPDAQVLATADGHPRAVGFISRVPAPTLAGLNKHAFYLRLVATQEGRRNTPAELAAASRDARRMDIGWVLVWNWQTPGHAVLKYLRETGFRFAYSTRNVRVYRPAAHSASSV